jgi:hypothetical protein
MRWPRKSRRDGWQRSGEVEVFRSVDMPRQFFDLSDAELRIARCVTQGHNPEQITAMLDARHPNECRVLTFRRIL